jgi:LysM repeat protein
VSLHLNAASNAAASGAEGWHGAGDRDAELAAALLDGAAPALRRYGVGMRGTRAGPELAVLRGRAPSALVELGYVSNPGDAQALAQAGFRAQVAEGLAEGLVRFRDGRTQARPQVTLMGMGGAGPALPGLYFVRPGDTLRAIAARLGVPHEALKLLDDAGAATAQPLQVGQPLQIAAEVQRDQAPVQLRAVPQTRASAAATPAMTRGATGARGSYVVNAGDTLTRIAKTNDVSVRELAQWNGLPDPDLIRVGEQLRVTAGAPAGAAAGEAARYVVPAGETLSHVALMWGTTVEAVQRANGLKDPDHVEAGQALVRPKG